MRKIKKVCSLFVIEDKLFTLTLIPSKCVQIKVYILFVKKIYYIRL